MNLTMFDVTDIPEAAVGDEIVVMGSSGGESISGAEIASRIGTISYEVFCIFGGLNTLEYI
jgi:alanine racemase